MRLLMIIMECLKSQICLNGYLAYKIHTATTYLPWGINVIPGEPASKDLHGRVAEESCQSCSDLNKRMN